MLSLTCKASIKAVIFIGSKYGTGEKYGVKDIAKHINENEHTVGKLLQRLVRAKIINSLKGPNGGFFMSPEQRDIKVIEIINTIDGKEVFERCGLGLSECNDSKPCPFHNDYKPVREAFKNFCEQRSIAELYEGVLSGDSYLVG